MMHLPVPPFWLSFSTLFGAFSGWINPVAYGAYRVMRKEFLKVLRRQKELKLKEAAIRSKKWFLFVF